VGFEESRVLADDVHDIGCDHGFVVFATLDLAETQKIFDDGHKEAFLGLLVCAVTPKIQRGSITSQYTYSLRQRWNQ
jgi:hypothetical protein